MALCFFLSGVAQDKQAVAFYPGLRKQTVALSGVAQNNLITDFVITDSFKLARNQIAVPVVNVAVGVVLVSRVGRDGNFCCADRKGFICLVNRFPWRGGYKFIRNFHSVVIGFGADQRNGQITGGRVVIRLNFHRVIRVVGELVIRTAP